METIYKKLQECSICVGQLTSDVACVTLCGHLFHRTCINSVLKTDVNRRKCPNCRVAIDESNVIDIVYDVENVLENRNVQHEIDERQQE